VVLALLPGAPLNGSPGFFLLIAYRVLPGADAIHK
jgi:hypothetical protein